MSDKEEQKIAQAVTDKLIREVVNIYGEWYVVKSRDVKQESITTTIETIVQNA